MKETPQKADARDYEKTRWRRTGGRGGKDDGVGDDDKGGVRLCMNQTLRCRRNDSGKTKLPVT